jgi:1-deoxy-D-xylulose-5-phosphate synthase
MEYHILNNINSPDDVKKLDKKQLDELCVEIRDKLVNTVSTTGGHLASNLGTVELTVALHRSFDSPEDKIIWDVSHQAYTHKLLTGRYDKFDTIRTENGISGFTRPDESEHDIFYEGHAGTSISEALGIAASNSLKGKKDYTIAVIGDGAFGNGLVYEALNNAATNGNRLIVILNDNEMSISENVGAMARYLAVVRAKPEYYRFKARTEKALNRIPLIGKQLSNFLFQIKNTLKSIIYRSSIFEYFGFRYIGPLDGHDIPTLCEAMDSAKMIDKPVLIHVNTVKGKGYDYAEHSPDLFHGISKFDIDTGEPKHSGDSYSSEFGKAICEFASKDKRICAVTAAMALGTGLETFFNEFPQRAYDVGIAEEHAVTFCSGLAAGGMLPVFAVYSTFLQRCADQLIHDGALQRKKMVIAVDRAGFVGEDGETHQGLFDVSILQSLPNTTVYSPATYEDLKKDLYNAFYKDENLVVIRYPRGSMPKDVNTENLFEEDFEIIGNDDSEIALIAYGRMFFEAIKTQNDLKNTGIDIKIIKLNKIKPISTEVIDTASKCKNIFFFEESMKGGSIGEKIGAMLLENNYKGKYFHNAINDEFVAHAPVDSLMRKYKLDFKSISEIIKNEVTE